MKIISVLKGQLTLCLQHAFFELLYNSVNRHLIRNLKVIGMWRYVFFHWTGTVNWYQMG